ncbi:hypothetical protein ACVDG8_002490 [Mesorhizobium sp. ORM8.1]
MQTQNGYWWAISIHPDDDGQPEIIYVSGNEASRMIDDWGYHVGEFDLLHHVDTGAWPQEGKLTERELLDEGYTVDPASVHDGYWWAVSYEDAAPMIVRIEGDTVHRIDGEDRLNDYEFLLPIDTSNWPNPSIEVLNEDDG